MHLFLINKRQLIVSFIIASISLVGDANTENQSNPLVNAICDNVTHALIGAFTWIGIFVAKTLNTDIYFVFEIILCGLCSSFIDTDHFIAAKSLSLKDAISLKNRPFFHSTTLAGLIVSSVLLLSYLTKVSWLYKFGWILTTAFLSHHIRDSKRRGFWIWPFGHTMPTPFLLYIFAQMFLPQLLSAIIYKYSPSEIVRSEWISTVETV